MKGLIKKPETYSTRHPKLWLIEANTDGHRYARAVTRAWHPRNSLRVVLMDSEEFDEAVRRGRNLGSWR